MKLQTKFTLGLFLILSTLISTFSFVIYHQVRAGVYANSEKLLREEMEHEWTHVWQHPHEIRQTEAKSEVKADSHHEGIYLKVTEKLGVREEKLVINTFPPWLGLPRDLNPKRYLQTSFTKERDGKTYLLEGATDLTRVAQFLRVLGGMLVTGCLLVLAVSGPASWLLAGWGFRPFRRLAEQTEKLGATNLAFRFPEGDLPTRDEYVVLADSFNHLLERLGTAFNDLNLFAANASHELKTPVAAMMAQIEKLLRPKNGKDLDDETRATLTKMLAQGARLSRVTEQLLSLAAVDSRSAHLQLPPRNAADVLKTLMETYTPIAEQRGRQIELSGGATAPAPQPLIGNADLVATSVSNLVDNALKFSKSKVGLHYRTDSGWLVIEVEDDGPGILESQREEATTPFRRAAEMADGKKNPGSGLGLAIVKAATVSLRGQLTLGKSRWGGLLARLSLPMADAV